MAGRQQPVPSLEDRVLRAAEAALAGHDCVSAIDILTGLRLLQPRAVESWRKGRIPVLEPMIQGHPQKIERALALFREWAQSRGLAPTETRYLRHTREGPAELRFSQSGDPQVEKEWRTHYVSPALPERKREKLRERLERPPERVVFEILRDSRCSECGVELPQGSLLTMEAEQALCLDCAGLGDLEFLPAGDTALTRRAAKHSGRSPVVVRFSRARKRYERQGILVEEAALRQAEEETLSDAAARARQRERAAAARREQDRELVQAMAERIQQLFPGCPPKEARAIAAHTAVRGSGRVGRSAAGRALDDEALTLAVVAAVRHHHTNYDELLAAGLDRAAARQRVRQRVDDILDAWEEPTE